MSYNGLCYYLKEIACILKIVNKNLLFRRFENIFAYLAVIIGKYKSIIKSIIYPKSYLLKKDDPNSVRTFIHIYCRI